MAPGDSLPGVVTGFLHSFLDRYSCAMELPARSIRWLVAVGWCGSLCQAPGKRPAFGMSSPHPPPATGQLDDHLRYGSDRQFVSPLSGRRCTRWRRLVPPGPGEANLPESAFPTRTPRSRPPSPDRQNECGPVAGIEDRIELRSRRRGPRFSRWPDEAMAVSGLLAGSLHAVPHLGDVNGLDQGRLEHDRTIRIGERALPEHDA
jgi:hypothetical protein